MCLIQIKCVDFNYTQFDTFSIKLNTIQHNSISDFRNSLITHFEMISCWIWFQIRIQHEISSKSDILPSKKSENQNSGDIRPKLGQKSRLNLIFDFFWLGETLPISKFCADSESVIDSAIRAQYKKLLNFPIRKVRGVWPRSVHYLVKF